MPLTDDLAPATKEDLHHLTSRLDIFEVTVDQQFQMTFEHIERSAVETREHVDQRTEYMIRHMDAVAQDLKDEFQKGFKFFYTALKHDIDAVHEHSRGNADSIDILATRIDRLTGRIRKLEKASAGRS